MAESFEVGQRVIILPGGWGKKVAPVPARIMKVARIWMDVESVDKRFPLHWRIRKDTLDEGDRNYSQGNARLYTLELWAERERGQNAHAFLAEQGIRLDVDSPWRQREIELADLIRKAITDGEEEK